MPGFLRAVERDRKQPSSEDLVESGRLLAESLLLDAVNLGATDIHIDAHGDSTRVRFRVDGVLHDTSVLPTEQAARAVRHFKAVAGVDTADHFRPADARLTHTVEGRPIDLRLAVIPAVGGDTLSIRLLDRSKVLERLSDLGLTRDQHLKIEQWIANINGMFLVAGPTNAGKTTTLYALLHELKLHERCVMTIEDPVEYQIEGVVQMQVNRRHGLRFAEGLRTILRADPDYLLLGEIRDAEAAQAALEASGSGRVLMSTIHAPDAVSVVTALRNYGLVDHQITSSLRMVVAQRLVRRLCAHCRREEKLSDRDYQWLASMGVPSFTEKSWVAVGCEKCHKVGYAGRVGIFEVWRLADEDYDAMLRHADERTLRAGAYSRGLRHLIHDGWVKVTDGITSIEELKSLSNFCQLSSVS
jgi:type II secretory ATPase GspE/PulE/Tfp pilus assembly ATPase PilB-like protein